MTTESKTRKISALALAAFIVAGGQGAMIAENALQGLLECPK